MKQQLNNSLLNLAAWVALLLVLATLQLGWNSWQWWSIMAMALIIEYLARREGERAGVSRVMDMKPRQWMRLKRQWDQAGEQNEEHS